MLYTLLLLHIGVQCLVNKFLQCLLLCLFGNRAYNRIAYDAAVSVNYIGCRESVHICDEFPCLAV